MENAREIYSSGAVTGWQLSSRSEWLAERGKRIGASDAGALMGRNPWKTNVDLWLEKTGRLIPPDISEKPAVKYGTEAEAPIRSLFAVFHKYDLAVFYQPNNIFVNEDYPFAAASLDGWIIEPDGEGAFKRRGSLEIKTCEIQNSGQWAEWDGKIPEHYYCQALWQMMVTGWDFAILRAELRYRKGDDTYFSTRDYFIPRDDAEIAQLAEAGKKFAEAVKNDIQPALILPEIEG